MSGLSVSPLTSGDGGIVAGMLVRQILGGAVSTVTRAQADTLGHSQGNLYVVEFSTTAPGGKVLGDLAGRKRILLEAGLSPVNGNVLYLSAITAGRATNVRPVIATAIGIGTVLDASTYAGDNSVIAAFGGPIGSSFFELNLSFGGGPSGSGDNVLTPGSSVGFFMRPFCNTSTMFSNPNDGTPWEWECPIDATIGDLWVNCVTFGGSGGPSLTAIMTINGTPSGTVGVVFSAAGLVHVSATQAVTAGQKIGVFVNGGGTSVIADFTTRLRVA